MSERSVAVLHRHHRQHLEAACKVSEGVPFRSNRVWRKAELVLQERKSMDIYFVLDGSDQVEYTAQLVKVIINPDINAQAIQQTLACRTETTKNEDWSDSKTIYLIQDCRQLENKVPKTTFIKASNGEPIDVNFERGYAIVFTRSDLS